jgi:hypothetical protein
MYRNSGFARSGRTTINARCGEAAPACARGAVTELRRAKP